MDLDPTYKDAFGNPLLRITNSHTDQDRNLNRYANEICKQVLEQMGADIIDVDEISDDADFDHNFYSTHWAGGAIMGDNPDVSAVNNYSQMWDMENLFVVGGSSFPHFGNYNPTGTIGALAYRATEGMIKYLEENGGLLVEAKKEMSKA